MEKFAIYKDAFNGKREVWLTRIYLHGKVNLDFSLSGEDCIVYTSLQDAEDWVELIELETGTKLKIKQI